MNADGPSILSVILSGQWPIYVGKRTNPVIPARGSCPEAVAPRLRIVLINKQRCDRLPQEPEGANARDSLPPGRAPLTLGLYWRSIRTRCCCEINRQPCPMNPLALPALSR